MVKVKEDLTGRTFGKLIVKKQAEDYIKPNGRHIAQWLCECDCEKHTNLVVRGDYLKSGHTKSCGCSRKKYNDYILNLEDEHGLYGIDYCSNTNTEFYFDMEVYDQIKEICWCECIIHGLHCIVGSVPNNKKVTTMHLFLGYNGYDHADRNELNNRKYNLRKATVIENGQNKNKSTRNTSGIIGVSWNKRDKKWESYIKYEQKLIHLGEFINKNDAIKSRLQAENKYFGKFAPQQHLFKDYGI